MRTPSGAPCSSSDEEWTVVGVVGDVYQSSLETEPRTEAYTPMAQSRGAFAELVIRTSGDPYDVLPAVKSAVLQVMPDVPLAQHPHDGRDRSRGGRRSAS